MTRHSDLWASGDFADAYRQRNRNVTRTPFVRSVVLQTGASSVLEIGCGSGHNLSTLAGLTAPIVGVDVNADSLRDMLARTPGAVGVLAEAQRLPFVDGSFSFVFTAGCLIHLPPGDVQAALSEIHRVTKPGGHILIAEYESLSGEEEVVPGYHGQDAALWRRPWRRLMEQGRTDLELQWERDWKKDTGWDDVCARLWRRK